MGIFSKSKIKWEHWTQLPQDWVWLVPLEHAHLHYISLITTPLPSEFRFKNLERWPSPDAEKSLQYMHLFSRIPQRDSLPDRQKTMVKLPPFRPYNAGGGGSRHGWNKLWKTGSAKISGAKRPNKFAAALPLFQFAVHLLGAHGFFALQLRPCILWP